MTAWNAQVITQMPTLFPGFLGEGLAGRALAAGRWSLAVTDLRDFGQGRHRRLDDTPSGGGAGMVLRADVAGEALDAVRARAPALPVVLPSPRGAPLTQGVVERLAAADGAIFFCNRFEGVDERFLAAAAEDGGFMEVSLGDYIVAGGETAALVLLDAVVRLLPGVIGKEASHEVESFADGLLEYPHYTRPAVWRGRAIPEVLVSGDHAKIAAFRRAEAERITAARRPDLWAAYNARSKG